MNVDSNLFFLTLKLLINIFFDLNLQNRLYFRNYYFYSVNIIFNVIFLKQILY